jgi:hypothetical protein
MHAPFRDHFAVKVGQFLQEPNVLEELGPPGSRRLDVLILGDGRPDVVREFLLHGFPPSLSPMLNKRSLYSELITN